MGINYQEIESNSVGYKQDVIMRPMSFPEYLLAKGYSQEQIEGLYAYMSQLLPIPKSIYAAMMESFREYMVVGGMPAIVSRFIEQKNYGGILAMQRQILLDYEEDITKYAGGLDKTKILSFYRKVPVFLGKDNKKFQISKVAHGARKREYVGVKEWLENAGIINACYCMNELSLPLRGNYDADNFKLYFLDTGLLIATLDDEAQADLRENRNFATYKGALYENVLSEILVNQGYDLFFYKNDKGTLEIDFMVRDLSSLVPIGVKSSNGRANSLNALIDSTSYNDIKWGIKFVDGNIGFDGKTYTFPYFLAFFLRRFLSR